MSEKKETRKARPVKAAELRLDEGSRDFGFVSAPDDLIAPYITRQESPLEKSVRHIMETPNLHRKWLIAPISEEIGSVKAKATAKKWARTMTIDGTQVKLQSFAFKHTNRKGWGVAIAYDPDKQPKPRVSKDTVAAETMAAPPVPQPDIQQQQPSFDGGAQFV